MSGKEQIAQLNEARSIVAKQPSLYPEIIAGILPIASSSDQHIQRWVAEFLDASFRDEKLPSDQKLALGLSGVLKTVNLLLDRKDDEQIMRNMISCSTTLYSLMFYHLCTKNTSDRATWREITDIKAKIFLLWDSPKLSLRIACIKFVQRVLLAQTPGMNDPRLLDISDPSLTLLPLNHPIITHAFLEAEAQGLLDRLISITYEPSTPTVILTATMNALPRLVRFRKTIAPKIISALLQIRPHAMNTHFIDKRCIEKQLRIVLNFILRTESAGSYGPKIGAFLQGLPRVTPEDRKRSLDSEGGDEAAKRARYNQDLPETYTPPPAIPFMTPQAPAASGTVSYSQFYTLTTSELAHVNVQQMLNLEQVVKVTIGCLQLVDPFKLNEAITKLQIRYEEISKQQALVPLPETVEDIDDDNEPSAAMFAMAPFNLPEPIPLSSEDATLLATTLIERMVLQLPETPTINSDVVDPELSLSMHTKQGIACFVSRLCTRGPEQIQTLARERIFSYVTQDFKRRVSEAVTWLTEEWYNERKQESSNVVDGDKAVAVVKSNYKRWTLRLLDHIIPFLDVKDKVFIRCMSELPELDADMLARIKELCLDHDRSRLGFASLQYLLMFRPPCKNLCLNVLRELQEVEECQNAATKLLTKFNALQIEANNGESTPQIATTA